MRRDWWKIRHVLLAVRDGEDLGVHPSREVYEHLHLCSEAGFVAGFQITGPSLNHDFGILSPGRLTWEGQDATALLENADALQEVLAELEPVGTPWEVLRAALMRKRWPEWPQLFEDLHYERIPQSRRCPLCCGIGREPIFSSYGNTCPVCQGARVIKE